MTSALNAIDTNFVGLDSSLTKQTIAAYCLLDGIPDWELFQQRLAQLIKAFPRLTKIPQYTKPGYHWQEHSTFTLQDHWSIHHVRSHDRAALQSAAEQIFSSGFDFSKPPWHFAFFTNESSESSAMLMIHHCLADGLGGYELVSFLCSDHHLAAPLLIPRTHRHRHPQSKSIRRLDYLKLLGRVIAEFFRPETELPINGKNSAERRFLFFSFPLQELKLVKSRLGCSLNQLFLALVGDALGQYFTLKNISANSLRAIIPVSMRQPGDRLSLGNFLSGATVRIPLSPGKFPEQVVTIKQRWQEIEAQRLFGFYGILGRLNSYFPRFVQKFLCRFFARKTNFICSNIPGPYRPQYLAGAKISATFGIPALMEGHGLGFSFLTYAHTAYLAVIFDPAIISDPVELENCLNSSKHRLYSF